MPIFEDDDLKCGESMPENLKDKFLAKCKRLKDLREKEIKELENSWNNTIKDNNEFKKEFIEKPREMD